MNQYVKALKAPWYGGLPHWEILAWMFGGNLLAGLILYCLKTVWHLDVEWPTVYVSLLLLFGLAARMADSQSQKLEWFISASSSELQKLRSEVQSIKGAQGLEAVNKATEVTAWPWGAHHTELLGHLEAAAVRFWTLYDPTEPSTAPTNDMVSDWLRKERNVSREKAQAIASILRADGLRTGPRR